MGETGCASLRANEITTRSQRQNISQQRPQRPQSDFKWKKVKVATLSISKLGVLGHHQPHFNHKLCLCGLCGLCCELFCLCDLVCRSLAFALSLPVMDRQGVPVWIKDGGHSAPGEIQRFNYKLGAGVFEFLDRL